MKYDIATKRLLELNAKAILQEICGIDLKEAKLIDLPQAGCRCILHFACQILPD